MMNEIEKITSRDNRRLLETRKVRDGKSSARIFIEGRRLAAEALRSNLVIYEVFVSEQFRDDELINQVKKCAIKIAVVSERLFNSIADTEQSQGIIVIAERPKFSLPIIESRLGTAALPTVVFLRSIANPSNLGAILRTAEAADAAGVIVSENSVDVFSPKALRSAMGASFRIPVWPGADLTDVLNWAAQWNLIPTAADASGTRIYTQVDWKIPRLLIFGSEAHGLNDEELTKAEIVVRIPLANHVESLNLAVSAGIILFEARRQNADLTRDR